MTRQRTVILGEIPPLPPMEITPATETAPETCILTWDLTRLSPADRYEIFEKMQHLLRSWRPSVSPDCISSTDTLTMTGGGVRPPPSPPRRPRPAPAPHVVDTSPHIVASYGTYPEADRVYFSPSRGSDIHGDGSRERPYQSYATAATNRGQHRSMHNADRADPNQPVAVFH